MKSPFQLGIVSLACMFLFCSEAMDKQSVEDCGKKEIGQGVYLKKILVGDDRVYMLVDENDKLINGNVTSSITIHSKNSNRTESNSFLNQ